MESVHSDNAINELAWNIVYKIIILYLQFYSVLRIEYHAHESLKRFWDWGKNDSKHIRGLTSKITNLSLKNF